LISVGHFSDGFQSNFILLGGREQGLGTRD
jgi:hypothetical protein